MTDAASKYGILQSLKGGGLRKRYFGMGQNEVMAKRTPGVGGSKRGGSIGKQDGLIPRRKCPKSRAICQKIIIVALSIHSTPLLAGETALTPSISSA